MNSIHFKAEFRSCPGSPELQKGGGGPIQIFYQFSFGINLTYVHSIKKPPDLFRSRRFLKVRYPEIPTVSQHFRFSRTHHWPEQFSTYSPHRTGVWRGPDLPEWLSGNTPAHTGIAHHDPAVQVHPESDRHVPDFHFYRFQRSGDAVALQWCVQLYPQRIRAADQRCFYGYSRCLLAPSHLLQNKPAH